MADIARLGRVSRARVTQVMDLLLLAPDIQEEILFLPATESGRDPITLRAMRAVCAVAAWKKQRERGHQAPVSRSQFRRSQAHAESGKSDSEKERSDELRGFSKRLDRGS